jgi:precorrin-3B synthase
MSEPFVDAGSPRWRPRPSACPSLFRIVAARDGGICRVKLPIGHLTTAQAYAVAAAAGRFGNGVIELTNRANLQIRGVHADAEAALADALIAAGLGPARPETDDIRNVMVSPTAGVDPEQQINVLPLAHGLLARIECDPSFRSLSPKFSFLINGGESVAATARPHDIWLASMGDGMMALGFAGSPPIGLHDETPFIAIPEGRAIFAVAAAAHLFLDASADDPAVVRLRDLFSRMPRERFLDELSERLGVRERFDAATAAWSCRGLADAGPIGIHHQRQQGMTYLGVAPPLARLSPAMLERVIAIADAAGDGSIRLTPWHGLIVPFVPHSKAGQALEELRDAGFVVDRRNPLSLIVACSGAVGCRAGLSDTKSDALALAASLGEASKTIHVSGCAKGCALPTIADATLIASGAGSYQLYFRDGNGGLGPCVGGKLSIADIGARLREHVV